MSADNTPALTKHILSDLKELDKRNFTTTSIEFVTTYEGIDYRVVAVKQFNEWVIKESPVVLKK